MLDVVLFNIVFLYYDRVNIQIGLKLGKCLQIPCQLEGRFYA